MFDSGRDNHRAGRRLGVLAVRGFEPLAHEPYPLVRAAPPRLVAIAPPPTQP